MTTGEDNQEGRQLMFTDSSFGMLTENVEVPKLKNRELNFFDQLASKRLKNRQSY